MTPDQIANLPYRRNVGVMLVNAEGHAFVGQRLDSDVPAWQMPQGGIDDGETFEAATTAASEVGSVATICTCTCRTCTCCTAAGSRARSSRCRGGFVAPRIGQYHPCLLVQYQYLCRCIVATLETQRLRHARRGCQN